LRLKNKKKQHNNQLNQQRNPKKLRAEGKKTKTALITLDILMLIDTIQLKNTIFTL